MGQHGGDHKRFYGAPTPATTRSHGVSSEHVSHTSAARLKIQKNAIIAALL
jgi:hypothetical protein